MGQCLKARELCSNITYSVKELNFEHGIIHVENNWNDSSLELRMFYAVRESELSVEKSGLIVMSCVQLGDREHV